MNTAILEKFAAWYIWVVSAFVILCIGLAIWPAAGRLNLGADGEMPEFSNFSWFSMMFGAGVGVGMLTWAVAEPMAHFNNNPSVIQGFTTALDVDNVRVAYTWSYLRWGLGAWACYVIIGLSLAFFSYRRGLPLTIRSSLTPLFGKSLSSGLGNAIDILAVVAAILSVAQLLGFGVDQLIAGLTRIGIGGLSMQDGSATTLGVVVALFVVMGASTLSALSGVGRGIKWMSNITLVLSIFLLSFFIIFGATWFGFNALFIGIWDYLVALPSMSLNVFKSDGVETVASKLTQWSVHWSVSNWAHWIAFAPFVGMFFARISRGRSVREFVLGAMIVPSIMCFVWFAWVGGTAIELELYGGANGLILDATNSDKIFTMTEFMLAPVSSVLAWLMAVVIVTLMMTFLVTSTGSAIIVVNTINAGGGEGPKALHILFWGAALFLIVGALLISGGTGALQTAMVLGALPFSIVMALMCVALFKAIFNDGRRKRHELGTNPSEQAKAQTPH